MSPGVKLEDESVKVAIGCWQVFQPERSKPWRKLRPTLTSAGTSTCSLKQRCCWQAQVRHVIASDCHETKQQNAVNECFRRQHVASRSWEPCQHKRTSSLEDVSSCTCTSHAASLPLPPMSPSPVIPVGNRGSLCCCTYGRWHPRI
jgi:hypothetical protein